MQDDTTSSTTSEQSLETSAQSAEHLAQHCYYEVGAELLAKPGLLCDMIEAEGAPKTLIFCNAPSDADFVDVMLKKRGISSRKLIGHVPPHKIARSVAEIEEGKATALVMTDVSAEALDPFEFNLMINHSVPTDPDMYLERLSKASKPKNLKIVSFVGPLDFSNFHYLKKIVENEFIKLEPPSAQEVAQRRVVKMAETARGAAYLSDERVKSFVSLISGPELLSAEQRELILATLVNNFLNPTNNSFSASEQGSGEGSRHAPRERHSGGQGRNRSEGRDSERDHSDSEYGESRGEQGRSFQRRAPLPKDCRLYIGSGSRNGYTLAEFNQSLKEALDGSGVEYSESLVKRFSQREIYSFVDISEEICEASLEKLKDLEHKGSKISVYKAVTVPVQRSASADEGEGASSEPPRGRNGRAAQGNWDDSEEEPRRRSRSFDDDEE